LTTLIWSPVQSAVHHGDCALCGGALLQGGEVPDYQKLWPAWPKPGHDLQAILDPMIEFTQEKFA
jgi:hypothetical protein